MCCVFRTRWMWRLAWGMKKKKIRINIPVTWNKQNKTQRVELQMIKKPTRCAKSRKFSGRIWRQDFEFVWEAFRNDVNNDGLEESLSENLKIQRLINIHEVSFRSEKAFLNRVKICGLKCLIFSSFYQYYNVLLWLLNFEGLFKHPFSCLLKRLSNFLKEAFQCVS